MVIVHSELFWRGTVKSVPFAYFLAILPFSLAHKWFSLSSYLFILLNEQLDEHYCAWLLSVICQFYANADLRSAMSWRSNTAESSSTD